MPSLYITEQGARLIREAGQLVVLQGDDVLAAVPASRVDNVVVVGNVSVTTPALNLLLDRETDVMFLSTNGKFRGRLTRGGAGNVQLRRQQYERSSDQRFCLRMGQAFVVGKIRNARTICMRMDKTNVDPLTNQVIDDLRRMLDDVTSAATRSHLMGIEGRAARAYFNVVRRHLRPPWTFQRRSRRPPRDPVNVLLSIAYTLLEESCYAALHAAALDPYCGFYHAPRYGRASLAVDLMEEFRPVLADSVVLTLLHKRMIEPGQFHDAIEDEGVRLDQAGWRSVAQQYRRRLQTRVRPPGYQRRVTYQKVLELQARRLRRAIADGADTYQPFLVKSVAATSDE